MEDDWGCSCRSSWLGWIRSDVDLGSRKSLSLNSWRCNGVVCAWLSNNKSADCILLL